MIHVLWYPVFAEYMQRVLQETVFRSVLVAAEMAIESNRVEPNRAPNSAFLFETRFNRTEPKRSCSTQFDKSSKIKFRLKTPFPLTSAFTCNAKMKYHIKCWHRESEKSTFYAILVNRVESNRASNRTGPLFHSIESNCARFDEPSLRGGNPMAIDESWIWMSLLLYWYKVLLESMMTCLKLSRIFKETVDEFKDRSNDDQIDRRICMKDWGTVQLDQAAIFSFHCARLNCEAIIWMGRLLMPCTT